MDREAWRILESIPAINDLGSQFQEDIQAAILKALQNALSEDDLLEAFNAGWGAAKAGNIYSQEEEAREWLNER